MSENNHSEAIPKHDTPAMESTDPLSGGASGGSSEPLREWSYSGKAMRAQCVLYWLITLVVVSVMAFLSAQKIILGNVFLPAWIGTVVVLLLLWGQFYCVYFYRTWTIRYRLTEQRLDTMQGIFTKTTDTTELLYIDDLRLIVTLWDRLINGGVGKIVVYSSADKTDHQLFLIGIEEPQKMFDALNAARAKVRGKRGFITG